MLGLRNILLPSVFSTARVEITPQHDNEQARLLKKQIMGQQKLFSFFSRASDPKPILKSKSPTAAVAASKLFGKAEKQPSPAHSSRKETPTPETLKRKVPTAVVGGGSVVAGAKGLVDSPQHNLAKSDIEPQVGSSVEFFPRRKTFGTKFLFMTTGKMKTSIL